jgi:hypothetical protein
MRTKRQRGVVAIGARRTSAKTNPSCPFLSLRQIELITIGAKRTLLVENECQANPVPNEPLLCGRLWRCGPNDNVESSQSVPGAFLSNPYCAADCGDVDQTITWSRRNRCQENESAKSNPSCPFLYCAADCGDVDQTITWSRRNRCQELSYCAADLLADSWCHYPSCAAD